MVSVDSTPADPPARRRGPRGDLPRVPGRHPPRQQRPDEGLGRSRGGLTCKIHLAGEGGRRPLALLVTPGLLEVGRGPAAHPGHGTHPCRPAGWRTPTHPARPPRRRYGVFAPPQPPHRTRRNRRNRRNRRYLRRRQIKHTIPEPKNQRANRASPRQQGRPTRRLREDDLQAQERSGADNQRLKNSRRQLLPRGSTNAPTSSTAPSSSPRSGSGSARDPRLATRPSR